MVREDPNLEIECREPGEEKFTPHFFTKDFINKEFRIVQQEVPFLEAAKAYDDKGKAIECKLGEATYIYKHKGSELIDENDHAVSADEILNGKWFIKEEDKWVRLKKFLLKII